MKTVYIDAEFKCHTSGDGVMTAVETDIFDGKCDAYIEGYRFVPYGSTWVRDDGTVFTGEMLSPWKPWDALDAAQREYDRQQLAAYEAALSEIEKALGVSV